MQYKEGECPMPYIRLSTTKKIEPDTEQKLIDALGVALSAIPGKDPQWTMVEVSDGLRIYFGGEKQSDMVFADVSYVGKFSYNKKKEFTVAALESIHEVLGTPIDKICLKISEFTNWGAVGGFRDIYFEEN